VVDDSDQRAFDLCVAAQRREVRAAGQAGHSADQSGPQTQSAAPVIAGHAATIAVSARSVAEVAGERVGCDHSDFDDAVQLWVQAGEGAVDLSASDRMARKAY
jgi:hypothetical protein